MYSIDIADYLSNDSGQLVRVKYITLCKKGNENKTHFFRENHRLQVVATDSYIILAQSMVFGDFLKARIGLGCIP